eukprot:m.30732 g.30732  ORF g.30732 m.30732 type:complete len:74 (+) comp8233_c0_seq1:613-834(+)
MVLELFPKLGESMGQVLNDWDWKSNFTDVCVNYQGRLIFAYTNPPTGSQQINFYLWKATKTKALRFLLRLLFK